MLLFPCSPSHSGIAAAHWDCAGDEISQRQHLLPPDCSRLRRCFKYCVRRTAPTHPSTSLYTPASMLLCVFAEVISKRLLCVYVFLHRRDPFPKKKKSCYACKFFWVRERSFKNKKERSKRGNKRQRVRVGARERQRERGSRGADQ